MDKNSNGGELQLPVGFRFRPTDQELILYYLKPKAHSLPLPASFIPQLDEIFQSHPSHLPGTIFIFTYVCFSHVYSYLVSISVNFANFAWFMG